MHLTDGGVILYRFIEPITEEKKCRIPLSLRHKIEGLAGGIAQSELRLGEGRGNHSPPIRRLPVALLTRYGVNRGQQKRLRQPEPAQQPSFQCAPPTGAVDGNTTTSPTIPSTS